MSEPEVEWVGTCCGKHGSYTFYKGFKLTVNGQTRKYLLGEFYFVRNSKDRPICIAELQLVWHDANTGNQLASARLYFRPEATPGGRQNTHGKDELLYTDEKVVIKCRDMISLECDGAKWCYGMKAISELNLEVVNSPGTNDEVAKYRLCESVKKRQKSEITPAAREGAKIVILSFPAYCRYQSLMKKLSNGLVLTKMAIVAFGGIIKSNDSTWISFSRSSFHYPELDKFDFFSDNKAPVLKGRPRKKRSDKAMPKTRGKYRRRGSATARDNRISRRPSPETESSDENQTDTSEESMLGVHELPCPPRLVSAVKEEKPVLKEINQSVIRSVKQSSMIDEESAVIPPIPKLVKIEPKATDETTTAYKRLQEPALGPAPLPVCRVENVAMPRIEASCTKASVISSTYMATAGAHRKPMFVPIKIRPQENASRETQSRVVHVRVSGDVQSIAPSPASQKTVPASVQPALVSRATITTNRNIQPRMSAIVCATREDAAARGVVEDLPGDVGASEQSSENHADLKQNMKRRRGRRPGKSVKYIKIDGGVASEDQAMTPLQQVEVNVSGEQVNGEPASPVKDTTIVDSKSSPESVEDPAEREFMAILKNFMKKRSTPIEKIPALGFRKINLFKMFQVTRALGGYDEVTAKRLWRRVYNEVGGAPSITSAATNSRKHYERLLLPYERFMKGQDPSMMVEKSEPAADVEESKKIMTTQRDQNANVVLPNEPALTTLSEPPPKPSKPAVSVLEHTAYTSVPSKQSVEFVSSRNGGSPVVLYSSTVDQLSRRRDVSTKEITRTSPSLRYESRPNVITSVGERDRMPTESRSDAPALLPRANSQTRAYVTEVIDDDISTVCVSQKNRKSETKTSAAELERDAYAVREYSSRYENAAHESRVRSAAHEKRRAPENSRRAAENNRRAPDSGAIAHAKNDTPEMTHDLSSSSSLRDRNVKAAARDPNDGGVLMMNVRMADEKMRSASGRSARPRDDAFMSAFAVPVFQPSHFQHGVEFYDLPSGGFPSRTSSRIFMPPTHQVFPASSHPIGHMSPYPPHILAAIGTDPGPVYQFPIAGFYPAELPYPLDSGLSILRS